MRPTPSAMARFTDEFTLTVGDSLRQSIDLGLARSRFGIVVISPNFLQKDWPKRELDGLVAREINGVKVILPVWHNIDADQIRIHSPMLADRLGAPTSKGIDYVKSELLKAIRKNDPEASPVAAGLPGPSNRGSLARLDGQRRRQLLDDISALRETMVQYRIEMEADHSAQRFNKEAWQQKYRELEDQIATKIEQLSSKAEASTYRNRGNIPRAERSGRPGHFINPVLIDVCIYDLDYLKTFIHDYSRKVQG